jgi:hypothetical protein
VDPTNFTNTLTWNDYQEKDTCPVSPYHAAFTKADWPHSTWQSTKNNNGKFVVVQKTFTVTVKMDTVKSWVMKDEKTDDLLNHEQGHYNISALGARDFLNGVLNLEADTDAKLATAFANLKKSVQSLIDTINKMYDEDPNCGTSHGKLKDKQNQWDMRIKSLMNNPKGKLDSLATCPAPAKTNP